jgi:predicted flap endonuclease-1-like 5' DNA nuclease
MSNELLFFLGLIIVVALALIYQMVLSRRSQPTSHGEAHGDSAHPAEAHAEAEPPAAMAAAMAVPVEVTAEDDLEIIEGIGPAIARLLKGKGIPTFKALAAADPAHLRAILDEARLRIADPTSWPDQARLAADGDWDGLKALQDTLKGGRRAD